MKNGELKKVKVVRVSDGDGIVVRGFWRSKQIRLEGINCPEHDQPGGGDAKACLIGLVGGRHIYLEKRGKDRYKRTIATVYVMLNSELVNVNEHLVVNGHAWVTKKFNGYLSDRRRTNLSLLQEWAQKKRKGLWSQQNPIPPWEWRKFA